MLLHGYFADANDARQHSVELQSQEFVDICAKFGGGLPVVVFGLNERADGKIFNTAVVVADGICRGKMRKTVTYPPYDYYGLGTKFPVFETSGIKFGICICADTTYFEPARILALNGAQLILCPCYNKISRRHRLLPHMQNKAHLIARAVENHVWLVCSDVVCSEPDDISFGCTCVIEPYGNIASQAPVLDRRTARVQQSYGLLVVSVAVPYARATLQRSYSRVYCLAANKEERCCLRKHQCLLPSS